MPKRRLTAARRAQIAKWQQAGVQKRVLSGRHIPMGKMPLMFHNTTPRAADKIIATQQLNKSHYGGRIFMRQPTAKSNWGYYGPAIVGVRVPRKALKVEAGKQQASYGFSPTTFWVYKSALRGRKIKRYA